MSLPAPRRTDAAPAPLPARHSAGQHWSSQWTHSPQLNFAYATDTGAPNALTVRLSGKATYYPPGKTRTRSLFLQPDATAVPDLRASARWQLVLGWSSGKINRVPNPDGSGRFTDDGELPLALWTLPPPPDSEPTPPPGQPGRFWLWTVRLPGAYERLGLDPGEPLPLGFVANWHVDLVPGDAVACSTMTPLQSDVAWNVARRDGDAIPAHLLHPCAAAPRPLVPVQTVVLLHDGQEAPPRGTLTWREDPPAAALAPVRLQVQRSPDGVTWTDDADARAGGIRLGTEPGLALPVHFTSGSNPVEPGWHKRVNVVLAVPWSDTPRVFVAEATRTAPWVRLRLVAPAGGPPFPPLRWTPVAPAGPCQTPDLYAPMPPADHPFSQTALTRTTVGAPGTPPAHTDLELDITLWWNTGRRARGTSSPTLRTPPLGPDDVPHGQLELVLDANVLATKGSVPFRIVVVQITRGGKHGRVLAQTAGHADRASVNDALSRGLAWWVVQPAVTRSGVRDGPSLCPGPRDRTAPPPFVEPDVDPGGPSDPLIEPRTATLAEAGGVVAALFLLGRLVSG